MLLFFFSSLPLICFLVVFSILGVFFVLCVFLAVVLLDGDLDLLDHLVAHIVLLASSIATNFFGGGFTNGATKDVAEKALKRIGKQPP